MFMCRACDMRFEDHLMSTSFGPCEVCGLTTYTVDCQQPSHIPNQVPLKVKPPAPVIDEMARSSIVPLSLLADEVVVSIYPTKKQLNTFKKFVNTDSGHPKWAARERRSAMVLEEYAQTYGLFCTDLVEELFRAFLKCVDDTGC